MSGWGQAHVNNSIGFGQGAANNSIDWGLAHKEEVSWSGDTNLFGLNAITVTYRDRVLADGGTVEALACVDAFINSLTV